MRRCLQRPCSNQHSTGLGRILAQDRIDQVLHRVGFGHHAIRQAHAARIAKAQHQLDALEAAEAKFAFEVRRAPRAASSSSPRDPPARRGAAGRWQALPPRRWPCDRIVFGAPTGVVRAKYRPACESQIPPMKRAYHPATSGTSSGTGQSLCFVHTNDFPKIPLAWKVAN